jgi:hypothetical protein
MCFDPPGDLYKLFMKFSLHFIDSAIHSLTARMWPVQGRGRKFVFLDRGEVA